MPPPMLWPRTITLRSGFSSCDPHQFAEVGDELLHVPDPDALAAGPTVAPMVQAWSPEPAAPKRWATWS